MLIRDHIAVIVIALLVMVSAIAIVLSQHHSRGLITELQGLYVERDWLDTEWGQLLLEQSTWATPSRIEHFAGNKLNMSVPSHDNFVVLVHE
ncbi:MAG: cell division protein FtsL [Gammaproteobacteria bacterium]|nr:cell division protein FtsL [Gammaproteobacteria bacterium]PCH62468.1 MAG: cell division protein FtsL [Gammaproteobacteria bacterium]